jgi:uncharacterized protein (AIM24 family)
MGQLFWWDIKKGGMMVHAQAVRLSSERTLVGNARGQRAIAAAGMAMVDQLESRRLFAGDFGSVLTRGDDGADVANAVAVDPQGNQVVGGSFSESVDFSPGDVNVYLDEEDGTGFVAEYTVDGGFRWVRRLGGPVNDVAVDRLGNVYVTGSFNGTRDFDSTSGTLTLSSAGFDDIFVAKFDTNGNLQWARRAGSSLADAGLGIDVDYSGNAYVGGFFSGTTDFNPSSSVVNRTPQALTDGFIWKLTSAGNYSRISVLAGNGSERVTDVSVDNLGNAYATGRFDKSADFNPGSGSVLSFADATLGGNYDTFVWGLNSNGTYRFVKRIGGGLYESGEAVDIDAVGNVYVTGRFTYKTNFNPGGSGGMLTAYNASGADAFVAKYDSVGTFKWTKRIGSIETNDWGRGIAVDGSRNVYVTGQFTSIANLNPNGAALVASNGGTEGFVAKFDTNGNFVYGKDIGGEQNDVGRGIAVDALRGNVFVAGEFRDEVDFDPGSAEEDRTSNGNSDLFVLRLTQTESPLFWAQKLPNDVSTDEGRFVATDGFGNTYIAGLLRGAGDLNPTGDFTGYGPIGSAPDVFVAKFASDGTFMWSRVLTHRETDTDLGTEQIGGLAVDAFGNVVVVGTFQTYQYPLNFPNTEQELESDGQRSDAFIWKLNPSGGHVFAKRFGNEETETANGVALGNNGDIYVTGTFDYRVKWGPGADDEIVSGTGIEGYSQDVWVAKYNASGTIQWATASGGDGDDTPADIVFDFNADVARVVGTFDSASFKADRSYFSPSVSLGGSVSTFVARYTESGVGNQVRRFGGGTGETRGTSIDVDSLGGIYVTGDFTGTTDLDSGPGVVNRTAAGAAGKRDVFLTKLDNSGTHIWSSRIGGSNDDFARGIDVSEDNVFVVGDFRGSVDFDPSSLKYKTLTSSGPVSGFIWRMNRSGVFQSAHRITGSPWDVAATTGSIAHVVGNTSSGGGDFDPGAATTFPLETATSQDWFVLKFKSENTPSSPNIGGVIP